jgi:hypothetical protein
VVISESGTGQRTLFRNDNECLFSNYVSFYPIYGIRDVQAKLLIANAEYICYKWPHVCSVGHNDNPVLSSFMTYYRICGAEISFPFGAPAFNPEFSGVSVDRSFAFSVVFCRSLFALFLLTIVLSVFPVTASCYPFDIFKLSWCCSRTVAL